MVIRVGWLPTGTETAEDARQSVGLMMTQQSLNVVRNGYVPGVGGAQPFALTSTGSLSCSVGAGQLWLAPGIAATQGAYPVTVDASGSGLPTVSFSAGGSLARTDVIYVQVQDTAEDSSGFIRGQILVVQGANGGGVPSVPTGALPLWQVPVPASASSINFATATFVANPTVCLGGVFPASSGSKPPAAYAGQVRARLDTTFTAVPGPLEVYDGSAWQPAMPNAATQQSAWTSYPVVWGVSSGTAPSIGNGTLYAAYAKVGRIVTVKIQVAGGTTTTWGSGSYTWSLPFTANVAGFAVASRTQAGSWLAVASAVFYGGPSFIGQATPTVISCAVSGSGSTMNATTPNTFTSSGEIDITCTYESTT